MSIVSLVKKFHNDLDNIIRTEGVALAAKLMDNDDEEYVCNRLPIN